MSGATLPHSGPTDDESLRRFGEYVSSEVTRDLIKTKGNPVWLNKIAVWMVAVSHPR